MLLQHVWGIRDFCQERAYARATGLEDEHAWSRDFPIFADEDHPTDAIDDDDYFPSEDHHLKQKAKFKTSAIPQLSVAAIVPKRLASKGI